MGHRAAFHAGPAGWTAAQLAARLDTQFGSGKETAAQLAGALETHFGSGKETAAQLAAQFGGMAGKQTASKGRAKGSSSTGGGPINGPGKRKDWTEGTVMAWCPNCGAAGGKGKRHDKFKAEGGGHCGRYSLSAPPATLR